jgi:excisionase family DNA binding protein
MSTFSTREAAKKLGVDVATLSRHITSGKIPAPKTVQVGKVRLHSWTEQDVERVRAILPKIKNGRTTRHKKQVKKTQSKQKAKR